MEIKTNLSWLWDLDFTHCTVIYKCKKCNKNNKFRIASGGKGTLDFRKKAMINKFTVLDRIEK